MVWRSKSSFDAKIKIHIDLNENSISVSDNGCGMKREQFEYCLTPNISFKSNDNLRGKKGVGTTFLAYGFNNIKIYIKCDEFETSRCKILATNKKVCWKTASKYFMVMSIKNN